MCPVASNSQKPSNDSIKVDLHIQPIVSDVCLRPRRRDIFTVHLLQLRSTETSKHLGSHLDTTVDQVPAKDLHALCFNSTLCLVSGERFLDSTALPSERLIEKKKCFWIISDLQNDGTLSVQGKLADTTPSRKVQHTPLVYFPLIVVFIRRHGGIDVVFLESSRLVLYQNE